MLLYYLLLGAVAALNSDVQAAQVVLSPQPAESSVPAETGTWTVEKCLSVLQREANASDQRLESSGISPKEESNGFEMTVLLDYYPENEDSRRQQHYALLSENQKIALEQLETKADNQTDPAAAYLLGQCYLFGNFSVPLDPKKAVHYYEVASTNADTADVSSDSHFMLGFIYATGLFGQVEKNQGKAMLHYTSAADMGHIRAAMCLGYRYYCGTSVERNEDLALYYYGRVARHCTTLIDDPLGPVNIDKYAVRLSDFNDGLYGAGVSESLHREEEDELAKYDDLETNDVDRFLIEVYHSYKDAYNGGYLADRNYTRAFSRAKLCAKEGLRQPKVKGFQKFRGMRLRLDRTLDVELTGRCAAAVGHMYLRGEGVEQNFTESLVWLTTASELINESQLSADLGLIYQKGLGLEAPQPDKAREIYGNAYQTPAIYYQWGMLMLEQSDSIGWRLIEAAAREHYPSALYAVVQSYEQGNPLEIQRRVVLDDAKAFAEEMEPAVTNLDWAFANIASGDNARAMLAYGMAAEQGYESAQASLAYLLYPPVGYLEKPPQVPLARFQAAVGFYRESARQGNVDSMIFLGDIYSKGILNTTYSPEDDETCKYIIAPDHEKAVGVYREASSRRSHQASFNLGKAYENGVGVPRDFHLAKRYYDKALALKPEAYIPVQISLTRLKLKRWWAKLAGWDLTGVESDDDTGLPRRTWHELMHLYDRLRQHQLPPEPNQLALQNMARQQQQQQQYPPTPPPQRAVDPYNDDDDDLDPNFLFEADGELTSEDLIFMGIFISFMIFTVYTRWRNRRRRRENGEPEEPVQEQQRPQFRFMVIPL